MKQKYRGYIIINKKEDEPIGVVLSSTEKDISSTGFMEIFIDKDTAKRNIPSKYEDSYQIVRVIVLVDKMGIKKTGGQTRK